MYECHEEILDKIQELPEEIKKEVIDYMEFLIMKHQRKRGKRKFTFDWEGGLEEIKGQCSSVELQHKASEWR